ncbi:MAG TPA: hypothetical protein VFG79_00120 [Solirubrobacter sp.]|nr:hypothetical protein [Solirubrobacter sp.]
MTDRPIATILAAVAATVFVAAFAAAAVLRPEGATLSAGGAERAAPASAQETVALATLGAPSLSRVVALPKLQVPKVHKKKKLATKPPRVTPAAPPVVTAPAPVVTAAPPPPPVSVAPAPAPSTPNVGQTFDSKG